MLAIKLATAASVLPARAFVRVRMYSALTTPPPTPPAAEPSLIERGIAFIKQYYTGIQQLRANVPEYRRLQRLAPSELTRPQLRFVQQTRRDLSILAPFCLTLLLLPEAIPLFVVKNWVPSTCLTPQDVLKARTKRAARRREISTLLYGQIQRAPRVRPHDHLSTDTVLQLSHRAQGHFDPARVRWKQLYYCCRYFGVGWWGTHGMLVRRLERFLASTARDDRVIDRAGGVDKLTDKELIEASEERGISTVPVSPTPQQLRELMAVWIDLNRRHASDPAQVPMPLLMFSRIVQNEHIQRTLEGKRVQ
ncbi:hypothetical protein RI367_005755 [Sorochytrium milnesiophthora]